MQARLSFRSSVIVMATGLALVGCGRTMLWPGDEPLPGENCANGLDDDGDGLVDCADPDCQAFPACVGSKEICNNGIDDDKDGFTDCQDPECKTAANCQSKPEICSNGRDDDADGLVDCNDPECFTAPNCQTRREICNNGIDDDGDGLVDCKDPQCFGDPACRTRVEICTNGIDDDGNGLVDCKDPQCFSDPACQPKPEICDNGIDDDKDGFVDCQDLDCKGAPKCQPQPEVCNNGYDDDGDGLVDCNDPECFLAPNCQVKPEICGNGIDDDGDGLTDCKDPQCFSDPACQPKIEICNNKIDDDGDGAVDCKDPDCFGDPSCGPKTEICGNGIDDDGNGWVDCEDPACVTDPSCPAKKEVCTNGKDDDGDGLVDCDDPDCFKHPKCKVPGQEICNNGLDDDEDGKIDCADSDCASLPICKPGTEVCDNKKDDDGDGAADCDDPDCKTFPACMTTVCNPTVDFGTINPKGSTATKTVDLAGTSDVYLSTCVVPGGGEVVTRFTLSGQTDLKLEYDQLSGDHAFALFRAGLGEACNANSKGCFDPQSAKTGSFSIKSLDAGVYYLIVEAFAKGLEGKVKVTLSTGPATGVENCSNGIDDDGDGAVDCADLDCVLTPGCATQLCKYDVNLGTLVVDGPPKNANVNTATATNTYEESCAAGGGRERIIRFAMPTAAGLSITVLQGGWHVFGLHSDKGPGTKCNADKGSCFDSNKTPAFTLVYDDVEKGVYYYIVDALEAGAESFVDLTFQAFSNRGPELCSNGIDDDGDGLTDCMDPDCTGVLGCPGPVCVPDLKTGPLAPGTAGVSFQVDTTKANNDQTVPCALGGGKDVVIEVTLTQISGLEFQCFDTGDHVFGLFAAGDPRDPCDKNIENCADPNIGPLTCNFIMPNLQPGKYYLVVEAFKPGNEGLVGLTLSATPDHAQEICNNGLDDDGDGKIDCQDSNCASLPICLGKSCTPDQKLGLLPADGTAVNVAVTTMGAGDRVASSCAQGGGEDAIVGFTLVNSGSLEVDYAQFGNHVLAVFENKGTGFACDAAPIACKTTAGQPMGKILFGGLSAGEYYLVAEAVSGGSEGAVVMKLSAK
jgi:hypothetical protein